MNTTQQSQRGQSAIEYILIFSGASLTVITALTALNFGLDQWWGQLSAAFFLPSP